MFHVSVSLPLPATAQGDISSCMFPFLAVHSEEDPWTDSNGSIHLYNVSKASPVDKALSLLPGSVHAITKGEIGLQVLDLVLAWLQQRVHL